MILIIAVLVVITHLVIVVCICFFRHFLCVQCCWNTSSSKTFDHRCRFLILLCPLLLVCAFHASNAMVLSEYYYYLASGLRRYHEQEALGR